jgi:hypothetical protein
MVEGWLRSRTPQTTEDCALAAAALKILEIARSEGLALAYIAARDGEDRAQYWFANNMLSIVVVQGKKPNQSNFEALTRDKREGLVLDEDMAALRAMGADTPAYVNLIVTKEQFAKYLQWVRQTW